MTGTIPETERMERLVYLLAIGGSETGAQVVPPSARLKWERLGSALPLTRDWLDDDSDYGYGMFTDATPKDIGGKMNVAFVGDQFNSGLSDTELYFQRMRSIQPSQARGCRIMPFMVRLEDVRLNFVTGSWEGGASRWGCAMRSGSVKSGGWRWCDPLDGAYVPGHIERIERCIQPQLGLAVSLQWTQNIWWHVDVTLGDAPGIRLPVTADALNELWETRQRGGNRVRALVHWVQKHCRKRPSTGECDVVVRKHLRGGLSFAWNEMDVTIRPAYDDLSALHAQGLGLHIPDHVVTQ